ncbi:hypothetical protein K504DRAFT_479371 [Pleomassaria siparia CBS 279.74]|uniref:Uncharacterized protein n=1 Tax=Pleomassaria siparia CBS 279.74 TaxID=1314801 RepID=A0A6G1KLH4_9PLEO|nr:hypothetical protein K504DRAFT_479371 [Pleomassaria siparia CBS 279.74]
MVLDLFTLAGTVSAVGASEAVHQQRVLNRKAKSDERRAPFYLDVFCDAKSRKRDQVHGAMVVLRDGKLRIWPKDTKSGLPEFSDNKDSEPPPPHPFRGFYLPFPDEDLPHRPIPARPILGLVSTIPQSPSSRTEKEKLNWIYADKTTFEVKYGPRMRARDHVIGPWDWTEDDEQGLLLDDEESLVVVEEEEGGQGWAVYWDRGDDGLKGVEGVKNKRVLRCSLERRLVQEGEGKITVE